MAAQKFQVYGCREIYHESGTFDIKIVLNPKFYKGAHDFSVSFVDSDRKKSIPFSFEIWGRKINVKFKLGKTASNGVAYCDILKNDSVIGQIKFWVII